MTLALDIGASKIRIAEVFKTEVKNKRIIETPKTKSEIKNVIVSLIKDYAKNKKLDCICIGIAGLQKNGIIKCSPNMDFDNVNLKKLIEKKFKTKTYVGNDANCAGLSELHYGNGKGKKNFVLLTLGTGIGGAIMINSELYRGEGMAGEPGHMLIESKEFEKIASGSASVRLANEFGFKNITSFELELLAKQKNKKAIEVYKEIGRCLGIGILNIIYLLDPEIVILGGGFSKVEFIWPEMIKTIHQKDIAKRNIKVVRAKLGDDAGLIGAALLPQIK